MRRWRDSDVREEPGHYRVNISRSLPITNRTLPLGAYARRGTDNRVHVLVSYCQRLVEVN